MTPLEIFSVFSKFGLFLGSLCAVQLLVATRGRIAPALLALAAGLGIGLAGGLYRVVQLHYSPTARARMDAQVQATSPPNWKRLWLGSLLILLPVPITRALEAPAAVEFTVMTLVLVVVLVQFRRRSHR